jgi:hypothetical protein
MYFLMAHNVSITEVSCELLVKITSHPMLLLYWANTSILLLCEVCCKL